MLSFPSITGVAMFGSGHDQAGVLVEPSSSNQIDVTDVKQVADFLSLIWCVASLFSGHTPTDGPSAHH